MEDERKGLLPTHVSPFEAIRQVDAHRYEYWSAHDMARLLGYTEYGKFKNAIRKAEIACEKSGDAIIDHFAHTSEMVAIASGAKRNNNQLCERW